MGKAEASERVRNEWLRRVDAEYRSTAAAATMALWLVQIAASPDLVRAALRIAREELEHATLSHLVYVAAGGSGGLELDRSALEMPRTAGEPVENDVARLCVDMFCMGETVAVRLFGELRRRCDVPVARRALDRILRDEVGHREFGWTLLGWLLESPPYGARVRALVEGELNASLDRIRALYGMAPGATPEALPRDDARWGLMPAARYADLLRTAFERDYVPRFARLGIQTRLARPPVRG